MYAQETKFPVYCSNCWWGDSWDRYKNGRDFDFNRPFFEQFEELRNGSPHFAMAVLQSTMENSDYCNQAGYLKNCYLVFNSDESEQCLYGKGVNGCFDCLDCFKVSDGSACYESVNCTRCSFSTFMTDSHSCDNCHFGSNLIGCRNCFGCVNLRNKEFYFFNKKLPPDEYKAAVSRLRAEKTLPQIYDEFKQFKSRHFVKWMQEKNTENCTGDYLVNCKNCIECFDCENLENSKYCSDLKKADKVSFGNYDVSYFGLGVDHSYECSVAGYGVNHILFCEDVWESHDCMYSQFCVNSSHDLFGCVALRKAQYSILNKSYSKEEYDALVPRILEHMKKTGEYGEFFPISMSSFGYNETNAQEYFPLTKKEVLKRGWKWRDIKDPDYSGVTKKLKASIIPVNIKEIPDEILSWAIECEETGRLFQIQKLELAFYRKMNLSIPKLHPDERHKRRFESRNPRILESRVCSNCGTSLKTTVSIEKSNRVYCEKCYLEAVYYVA